MIGNASLFFVEGVAEELDAPGELWALMLDTQSTFDDLMGKVSFTQMMFLEIMGRLPNAAETAIVETAVRTAPDSHPRRKMAYGPTTLYVGCWPRL